MSVQPGFGGQQFLTEVTIPKVSELRSAFPSLDIQVDGGVNEETARLAVAAGANILVAGSAIFSPRSLLQPTVEGGPSRNINIMADAIKAIKTAFEH